MRKVEIAPSTMGDTGVTLITIGGSVAYYATTAIFELGWPWWERLITAAFIVAAMLITAGAVLMAIDRDRATRRTTR